MQATPSIQTASSIAAFFPSEKVVFNEGEVLCQTHSRVNHLYILLSGEVEFYLADELSDERTELVITDEPETVIGWERFIPTQRFITHVLVKSESAEFLKIEAEEFERELSNSLLQEICQQMYGLLEIIFYNQIDLLGKTVKQRAVKMDDYFISQESTLEERILLLRSSPFFGEFDENQIILLADLMERREYDANEMIYEQDQNCEGLYVLIQGEVSIRRQENESFLDLRSISTPGYIFGWSSSFGALDICRASTEYKTSLYFIPMHELENIIEHEAFGLEFFKSIIWLMGNQLQLSFSRYTSLLNSHSLLSVKQLIDVNASRIPLSSPLHDVPILLQNTRTHHLAFSSIHQLQKNGTRQERYISSICLDLLKGEERELMFLDSISEVYEAVAKGNPNEPQVNKKRCAERTRKVFDFVSWHLDGWDNLPEESGNIFIYNHLVNHPKYTLNNHFQLTLDSHFISGMILDEKYGDPGMRTVRYGKSHEFGHQEYYDNLGYLNVYTSDSDLKDKKTRDQAKERFYEQANEILENGINFIVSPEGTSFVSEESPGPFKMGPFNLAQKASKEPHIVPIVFFNFDKRITENHFYCKILEPFKISEKKSPDQSLKEFVNEYQKEFKKEVEQAGEHAYELFNKLNN